AMSASDFTTKRDRFRAAQNETARGETRIILAAEDDFPRKVDPTLLKAVARSRAWFEELASGRVRAGATQLAHILGLAAETLTRLSAIQGAGQPEFLLFWLPLQTSPCRSFLNVADAEAHSHKAGSTANLARPRPGSHRSWCCRAIGRQLQLRR